MMTSLFETGENEVSFYSDMLSKSFYLVPTGSEVQIIRDDNFNYKVISKIHKLPARDIHQLCHKLERDCLLSVLKNLDEESRKKVVEFSQLSKLNHDQQSKTTGLQDNNILNVMERSFRLADYILDISSDVSVKDMFVKSLSTVFDKLKLKLGKNLTDQNFKISGKAFFSHEVSKVKGIFPILNYSCNLGLMIRNAYAHDSIVHDDNKMKLMSFLHPELSQFESLLEEKKRVIIMNENSQCLSAVACEKGVALEWLVKRLNEFYEKIPEAKQYSTQGNCWL
jgi:hypothetical protein